jgi:hypothetical protein
MIQQQARERHDLRASARMSNAHVFAGQDTFAGSGVGGEFIGGDSGGELASTHAYCATLIAWVRGSLRPGEAAAMIRRSRAEKGR